MGKPDLPATQQDPSQLSESEWRHQLTPEQYQVLRRRGTEPPHTGAYVHVTRQGTYHCAGCGHALFRSDHKYHSGSGWPSFWDVADPAAVTRHRDWSMLLPRTELRCAYCGGHLGHVFKGGPQPSGQRYCINSAALRLAAGVEHKSDD